MNRKEIASNFLKMAATGDVRNAYKNYLSPHFKHHNQYFKGDRESLMLAMEEAHKMSPNKSFEIKSVLEDGDKVVTFSRVAQEKQEIAVFHMFRFEGEKIVEMWDVGQLISPDSPNLNGMF